MDHTTSWIDNKLLTGSSTPHTLIVLAHGAGAPMDTPFMTHFAETLATDASANMPISVLRFEFPYMAARRSDGIKKPPPRADKSLAPFTAVIDWARTTLKPKQLIIGGKSMGGRIASMLAAEDGTSSLDGLICLGYPFHAPGRTDRVRIAHFPDISCPSLIVQGARDPFGGEDLINALGLSVPFDIALIPDGDHDLKPRKRIDGKPSGLTHDANLDRASRAIKIWLSSLKG